MAKSSDRDEIYEAAALFVERALRSDDSLFAAGHRVWTRENAEDLFKRFNEQPITTSESFDAKLQQQLAGAPDDTIHLAAEILFVHLLIVADIKSRKKREIIDGVEALSSQPVAIPPKLEASLDAGLAAGGMGFRTWRPSQVGFFVEFLRAWKSLAQSEQLQLLDDPWAFRTFIFGIPENSGFAQRSALLHLVHPQSFEPIVSRDHKKAIAKAFGHLVSDPTADVDRQLFQIRSQLAPRLGRETFHFYEPDLRPQWQPDTSDADRWDAFIAWAKKLYARPTFDAEERNYKLEVADNVRRVRDAITGSSTDWLPALKKAFGKPNNLTDWRANDKFSKWANADPAGAGSALTTLWDAAASPPDAVKAFLELAPKNVVSGAQLSISSFFLLGVDPTQFAFYRAQVVEKACRLTGYPTPPKYLDRGARYEHFLGFLDRVVEEAESRGLELRDRLDAQSLVWWIVQGDPPADWSAEERAALTTYREGNAEPQQKETSVSPIGSENLAELVSRFKREAPYPNEKDPAQLRAREEFASYITPEALEEPEWDKIQLLYSSSKYGFPGPMPELNRYINAADEQGLTKLRDAIAHLLYGTGDLSKRLDDLIEGDYRIPGLGEGVATKLLAINQPTEILPTYVTEGKAGKARLMQLPPLSLKPPSSGTRGERAVAANKALHAALHPHFGDDMWGMGRFLFWLVNKDAESPALEASLRDLADDLLLSEAWLAEVLSLLRDRKQIIFYGPPGTGKTYIARKIMDFIAKDESRRAIVQFHPSYSYEDFVQGYRPVARDDGSLSYTLKPGPLLRLANRARDSAGEHVLLIDEINRGNLPKILGELLYLLEYRDDEIDLMYAEGTSRFAMPENLLVIGTMNTADRSIGLIDAALRRRFHFVPLFPNEEPLVGLLDRWFQRFIPAMAHVGELVDRLNARLRQQFGPHLQVGPSHFLRRDLDEALLQRIWKHDVMPFLEDQLFSHENELSAFTIEKLMGQTDADDSIEGASAVEADASDSD